MSKGIAAIIQGVFLHWASPKKLKYGKSRLGESDTPNLAYINFFVHRTFMWVGWGGGTSEKNTLYIRQKDINQAKA